MTAELSCNDVSLPISDAQRANFEEQGFLILRQQISPVVTQTILQTAKAHVQGEVGPLEFEAELHYPGAPDSLEDRGGRTIRRLKHAQGRHPIVTEFVNSPIVAGTLRLLLGEPVVMSLAHHNCIMTKQPAFSSETGWHQDIRYWSFNRPDLISVWLALGKEFPENGSLCVIPGSHRWQITREQLDAQLFFRADLAENQTLISRKIELELEPGDLVFFHCRTLHYASHNRTDQTKYSAVFTFRGASNPPRPGTRSDAMPELLLSDPLRTSPQ